MKGLDEQRRKVCLTREIPEDQPVQLQGLNWPRKKARSFKEHPSAAKAALHSGAVFWHG
jgi:hypothetical protein